MTTNYNRSPLRSLYNSQDAQSVANRNMSVRHSQQLGGLSQVRKQPTLGGGMTDAEETKVKQALVRKGIKSGYDYAKAPDSTVPTESWNTPTPTENYIDSGSMDGGQSLANTPTDSEAYIDNGGMGQGDGSGSSSDASSGSYLGAVTGALAGYGAGTANSQTDPAMTSGEDGYGKYDTFGWGGGYKDSMGNKHYDRRADVGGATLGGWLGWEGFAPLSSAAVKWFHPYAQDMTRDVINLGGSLGGAGGAMLLDPAGTMASGKYSQRDIAESGAEAAASGGLSLLGHSDIGSKITDEVKNACFLTTAAVEVLGLPDDCDELQTLRKFRDTWLTEHHPKTIADYYAIAPWIVKTLGKGRKAQNLFRKMFIDYITPAVKSIKAGDNEGAYKTYLSMVLFATRIAEKEAQEKQNG